MQRPVSEIKMVKMILNHNETGLKLAFCVERVHKRHIATDLEDI